MMQPDGGQAGLHGPAVATRGERNTCGAVAFADSSDEIGAAVQHTAAPGVSCSPGDEPVAEPTVQGGRGGAAFGAASVTVSSCTCCGSSVGVSGDSWWWRSDWTLPAVDDSPRAVRRPWRLRMCAIAASGESRPCRGNHFRHLAFGDRSSGCARPTAQRIALRNRNLRMGHWPAVHPSEESRQLSSKASVRRSPRQRPTSPSHRRLAPKQ